MNFRYRLMQFMAGRYGTDKMFYVLFGLAAAFSIINIFARSGFLQILVYALVVYAFFRFFSRNHEARQIENRWIVNLISKAKRRQELYRQRKADYTHIYKKCPRCHAVLRLPRKKGRHTTICPKCSHEFSLRVR